MYLLLFTICVLVISLRVNAQPNLTVLQIDTGVVACHQGMISMTIENDSIENVSGLFMLDYYNSNWISSNVDISITTLDSIFDITFSGIGQIMHDYDSIRVQYRHYANNDTILIGYYGIHCPNLSIDEYYTNDMNISSTILYNMSGQPIKDTDAYNMYIKLITYSNGKQRWEKILKQ